MKKCLLSIVLIFALIILLNGCSDKNTQTDTITNDDTIVSSDETSIKDLMDIAMQHAKDNKVLATVNGVEITQIHKDTYNISGENYSTSELVKSFIIADYVQKQGLTINKNAQARIDSLRTDMEEDKELTNEYCLKAYGISKEEAIDYMMLRSNYMWLQSAFFEMVAKQVTNGETPKLYPELKEAYATYEKNVSTDTYVALKEIAQAYYEMIAKDYDIVIFEE